MKDIKKQLADHAADVLPDARVKENIVRELGFAAADAQPAREDRQKAARRRRVTFASVGAFVCACAVVLSVALPVLLRKTPALPGPSVDNKFDRITDADSFYAYGAASVGALLGDGGAAGLSPARQVSAPRLMSAPRQAAAAPAGSDASADGRLGAVQRYMPLVETLLSDGAITGTAAEPAEGYAYAMTVTHADLSDTTVVYTLYYDKIFLNAETDDDETEENYAIEGILRTGDGDYPVEGKYETENAADEAESELYFIAYTDESRRSYIEVSQESETETEGAETESEQEYVYSIYSGGALAERTTLEYESEDGEAELKMTVERTDPRGRDELHFSERTENGARVLAARGTVGGEPVRFTVHIREGEYHYVFEDGTSEDHDRYDDDEDDD